MSVPSISMLRRTGWAILAGIAGSFFALSAIGTAWRVGLALRDGDLGWAASAVGLGAVSLLFWWWITLGAWVRFRPPVDPVTGAREPVEPVGPWGWVGRALLALILLGMVGGGFWVVTADRRATERAEDVRSRAVAQARTRDLTLADVIDARNEGAPLAYVDEPGPTPMDRLIGVRGATISSYVVDEEGAVFVLRPTAGPPCAVLAVDDHDLVTSKLTDDCS